MSEPSDSSSVGDDEATARLLRLAGARADVSSVRTARVRSAVRAEWKTRARRRLFYRRAVLAASLVTTVALLPIAGRLFPTTTPLGEPVAVVEQLDGSGPATRRGSSVRVGEWIDTGAHARMALRFTDGTSVRLDTASRVRALSATIVELATGAVYVDTGREQGRFEVRTALATAHDVGTQFEVRLVDDALRLRVRTGIVELRDRARSIAGRPGTEIMLSATGAVRRPIAIHGAEWDWITRLMPPPEMEGMTLAAFLEQIAREQGWVLEYVDPTIMREAHGIVLHGSVTGLAAHEAVDVAVATSGLGHRLGGGSLIVHRDTSRQPPERGDTR